MIPEKQLIDMGFTEVKPKLFKKEITRKTRIYRDYRSENPSTYAYFEDKRIDPYQFKESISIENIEESMSQIRPEISLEEFMHGKAY